MINSRKFVNETSNIDSCYMIHLICEMMKDNVLNMQYDINLSNWFNIADGFVQVLNGSLDSLIDAGNSFSEFNSNLMDTQLKQHEYQEMYKKEEYKGIQNNERKTWARIQNNNILNQLANAYSNDNNKVKPIYQEENQGLQKEGIEGKLIEISENNKILSKIAQSVKILASRNNSGSTNTGLLTECDDYSVSITDLALDITETENYPKDLNSLLNEDYKSNLIGLGLAVAICSCVGKVCSNVYNMIKEKKIEEINEAKDKFEKCRSSTLTLISYIMSNSEKIMTNKINSDIIAKRDSEWWMAVFDKIGNNYNCEILYTLYNIRYSRTVDFPYFEELYHSFFLEYQTGNAFSLFQLPSHNLMVTEINQSLNDIYVTQRNKIYTREDLVSFSKIQRVKNILYFYLANLFDSKGMLYKLQIKLLFPDSSDYCNLYYFLYEFNEYCEGYYIGDKVISFSFNNAKELISQTFYADPNFEEIMELYDEIKSSF